MDEAISALVREAEELSASGHHGDAAGLLREVVLKTPSFSMATHFLDERRLDELSLASQISGSSIRDASRLRTALCLLDWRTHHQKMLELSSRAMAVDPVADSPRREFVKYRFFAGVEGSRTVPDSLRDVSTDFQYLWTAYGSFAKAATLHAVLLRGITRMSTPEAVPTLIDIADWLESRSPLQARVVMAHVRTVRALEQI